MIRDSSWKPIITTRTQSKHHFGFEIFSELSKMSNIWKNKKVPRLITNKSTNYLTSSPISSLTLLLDWITNYKMIYLSSGNTDRNIVLPGVSYMLFQISCIWYSTRKCTAWFVSNILQDRDCSTKCRFQTSQSL